MFRIQPILDASGSITLKVEGQIRETDLDAWSDALELITGLRESHVVVDLHSTSYIHPSAIHQLSARTRKRIRLINCSPLVRSILTVEDGFGGSIS